MTEQNVHIYRKIAERAGQLGFADFGCAPAQRLSEEALFYGRALDCGHFADMGYLGRNLEKRFDPRLLVPGTRTVLCFLAPYGPASAGSPHFKVSAYARGRDYHAVMKEKLRLILQDLQQWVPGTSGRVFVDSAPVLERAWAVRAGLGFIGKNNFLISRKCGIRHLIGVILTDLEPDFPPAEIQPARCGNCTRCLDSCPTGALCAPFTLDARKCISYQTIESRLPADWEPEPVFRDGWYFGCDACLNACPWNRMNRPGWPAFSERDEWFARLEPGWWEEQTEESFARQFRDSPLQRAGLEKIRDSLRTCRVQQTVSRPSPHTGGPCPGLPPEHP